MLIIESFNVFRGATEILKESKRIQFNLQCYSE